MDENALLNGQGCAAAAPKNIATLSEWFLSLFMRACPLLTNTVETLDVSKALFYTAITNTSWLFFYCRHDCSARPHRGFENYCFSVDRKIIMGDDPMEAHTRLNLSKIQYSTLSSLLHTVIEFVNIYHFQECFQQGHGLCFAKRNNFADKEVF